MFVSEFLLASGHPLGEKFVFCVCYYCMPSVLMNEIHFLGRSSSLG